MERSLRNPTRNGTILENASPMAIHQKDGHLLGRNRQQNVLIVAGRMFPQ